MGVFLPPPSRPEPLRPLRCVQLALKKPIALSNAGGRLEKFEKRTSKKAGVTGYPILGPNLACGGGGEGQSFLNPAGRAAPLPLPILID